MAKANAPHMVVDTSAVLAVLISEPVRPAVLAVTRSATLLAAPSLPWEVGNALVALARRRVVAMADVQRAWEAFERVPVRYVEIEAAAALSVAIQAGLYAYDAYVIEAARAARAPLLSLDRRQRDAARTVGVEVVEVIS